MNQYKLRALKKKEILKKQKDDIHTPNFEKYDNLELMQQKLKLENSGDLTLKSIAFVDFKKVDPGHEIQDRIIAENERQKSKIEILS